MRTCVLMFPRVSVLRMVYPCPGATITKQHKPGVLRQMHCLSVLQARSPKSRGWHGHAPLGPVGETLPCHVQASVWWPSAVSSSASVGCAPVPHWPPPEVCVSSSLLMRNQFYWVKGSPNFRVTSS